MPSGASTRRYAQAVFQLAVEHDTLERWLDDLTQLADSITNEEFSRTLSAPRISMEQKEGIIRESLGSSVDRLALNLMFLLTSRNLVHLLPDIADSFQEMLDAHQGIERAEVVSAVPLSDAQQSEISEMLARMSGKQVRVTTRTDPQIIGGMVIRVGDQVMDGSARGRLQAMRRELVERR